MADDIVQVIADTRTDAATLQQVVNGDADTQITSRLGESYPSVQKAIKLMTQSGLSFTAFETKALMTASSLANGSYAIVTNDTTTNNGLHLKKSGSWSKVSYDIDERQKTYTDVAANAALASSKTYADGVGSSALNQSKLYTDDMVINNTVLSGSVDGTELAIFTDKNGRRTWLEVAADGGITERTKDLIRDAVFTPVDTLSFSYVVTDKNGRVLSAIYKDGSAYPKQPDTPAASDKRFKILGIGNSFTLDAFMYMPYLLKEMGITNFEFAAMAYGGCTLEQHWGFASNDSKVYNFYTYESETETWLLHSPKTFKEGLSYTEFDTITLQQQSERSSDYTTYQPFLNNLIDYIYANINYSTKLGWHSIPASPDDGWSTTYPTSTEFYNAQLQAVENVLRDTPIEYFIPNNTAIQNARSTVLGELGVQSNMTHDGLHLQEGIPALVASYAATLKFIEVSNTNKSIFGSRFAPTDSWLSTKIIHGQNGPSVGVTTSNILIAQKCAIAAIKNQFETSTIN